MGNNNIFLNALIYVEKVENLLEVMFDEIDNEIDHLFQGLYESCSFEILDNRFNLKVIFTASDDYRTFKLNEIRYVKFYYEDDSVFFNITESDESIYDMENDYVTNVLEKYIADKLSIRHIREMKMEGKRQ